MTQAPTPTTSEGGPQPREAAPDHSKTRPQSAVSNDRLQRQISVCKIQPGGAMFVQRSVTVAGMLDEIRDGKFREEIGTVRTAVVRHGKDTPEVKSAKLNLPAYLLSGRIEGRVKAAMAEGRFHHSGLLQLDFDHIADPEALRDQLATDPHVVAAWLSPSGEGVKGLAAIPAATSEEEHRAAFYAAEEYFAARGLSLDTQCKNTNRLCFAGWDSDLRVNGGEVVAFEPREAPPAANDGGLVLRANDHRDLDPATVREMLACIPYPGYDKWLKIANAAWDAIGEEATPILQEWAPEKKPGDYAEKFAHRLADVHAGTLVMFAKEHGYRQPPTERTPDGKSARLQTINGKTAVELPCPGRPLSDFAADVGRLLAGTGVYSRGGIAFTVDHATKQLAPVDPQWLRTWAEDKLALFKAQTSTNGASITLRHTMSLDVARALVVSPQFLTPLPQIKRFSPVRLPVMRANGAIELLPDGFDPETLTLTDPTGCKYQLDIAPELGAQAIRGLLAEFPFADERSRAAAVAAMLTVYAGGLLPPASTNPAFIYLANAEGSGKTTLAQLAGIPYGVCEAESKPATEEEWQKALLALAMGGARLLLLDNLKGHLNSPSFEAYLTATKFSGRILGVNKKFSGDADAVVLLTGNRLTVSPDLRRRCIFVELFMNELRAEDRIFKKRLDAPAILGGQPAILAALWCMVRGWDAAGRPPASKINSSVPRWSEVIAGIVEWAGFACPSVPAELQDGGDTDTRDIARLGAIMPPAKPFRFSELCNLCAEHGLFERFTDDLDDDGQAGLKARKSLSAVLKTFDRRMVAPGRRFEAEGKGHQRRYFIK